VSFRHRRFTGEVVSCHSDFTEFPELKLHTVTGVRTWLVTRSSERPACGNVSECRMR
jgi:hypothetical protein